MCWRLRDKAAVLLPASVGRPAIQVETDSRCAEFKRFSSPQWANSHVSIKPSTRRPESPFGIGSEGRGGLAAATLGCRQLTVLPEQPLSWR